METTELENQIEIVNAKTARQIEMYKNKKEHLEDEKIVLQNENENIKARINSLQKSIAEYESKIKFLMEYGA